jgi:hypothetical protein
MQHNKHPITGRASRAVDAVVVDGASARLAKLTRDAALLEADALHWADTGNARFAIGCAREAAALRAEAKRLAEVKFRARGKTRTVTFQRDPGRVAKAPNKLLKHAEVLMTRNGRGGFAETFFNAAGRALDDLLAIGNAKAKRTAAGGLMTNRGARVH